MEGNSGHISVRITGQTQQSKKHASNWVWGTQVRSKQSYYILNDHADHTHTAGVTLLAVFLIDVTDNRQLEDCCYIEQANQVSDCLTRETFASNMVAYLNCGKLRYFSVLGYFASL